MALQLNESEVKVTTPDGTCDAFFVHPASGKHAGVIIWPDAFGLRNTFREFGRRMAGESFSVLVVNPYYRIGQAPLGEGLDFNDATDRAKLMDLMGSLSDERIEKDAKAYVAFLDGQAATDTSKKIGTQGYCMGGRLTMITASTVPDRIGAGGSFHGGGLVTANPNSPHLKIAKMKAQYYVGISIDDHEAQPDAKDTLAEAFKKAGLKAEVTVYEKALHGWCVPDMGSKNGTPIYKKDDAEKAWSDLVALYKKAL